MSLRGAFLALAAVWPLAACAGAPQPSGREEALAALQAPDPVPHDDAKFRAAYGARTFLVDFRYIRLIDESVVAVREARGRDVDTQYRPLPGRGRAQVPTENFSSPAYEPLALEIAARVQAVDGVCPSGVDMDLARNAEGDIRTLYRGNRKAWVVFARCVEKAPG